MFRARWAAVAGAACLALVATAVAASHAAPITEASPLVPDGPWRPLFVIGVVGALAAYLAGVFALRRHAVRMRVVIALAAAIQLAPLAAPLLLSKDVYAYWAYGRVGAVHGENPYVVPPARFPSDPATERMGADWIDTSSLYGPAFTAVSEAHAAAVGPAPATATFAYRLLAAAAMVAVSVLAGVAAARPAFAVAFVGWNPLLALHFAGGGHNDALMMVPVLAALALTARGRHRVAAAAWAVAIAVKWVPLVLVPLWAVAMRGRKSGVLLAGGAAAAALAALASARYGWSWLGVFGAGSADAQWASSISLPFHATRAGVPKSVAILALGLLYALAYVWLLLEARRGRARLGLATGLLVVSTPWLVPWYAVWVVSLAAVEEDRAARALALVLTAYLLRDAVPL